MKTKTAHEDHLPSCTVLPSVTGCLHRVLLKRAGKLIRAGSGLETAFDTVKSPDDLIYIHPLDKTRDTLCVAIASADKTHIVHLVILDLELDSLGTGPESFVCVHLTSSFHIGLRRKRTVIVADSAGKRKRFLKSQDFEKSLDNAGWVRYNDQAITECSSVWYERLVRDQEAAGSSPVIPTHDRR